jgi:hypothetical protein
LEEENAPADGRLGSLGGKPPSMALLMKLTATKAVTPKLPSLPSAGAFSSSNFLYSFIPALIGNVLFLASMALLMKLTATKAVKRAKTIRIQINTGSLRRNQDPASWACQGLL